MNDKQKEQLSAFLDNEIGPNELSEIQADDSLLYRYQLMGDAMKGNLGNASFVDVSAQVSAAIADEPVHNVNVAKPKAIKQESQETQSWFDLSAWLRPVGGMAVAASVAVVMVMVFNQPENSDIGINPGGQIASDSRPVVSLPVSNVTGTTRYNAVTTKNKKELEDELRNKKAKATNLQ